MNPVRYQTPAEKTNVIKPAPEDQVASMLAALKARLEAHKAAMPDCSDLNKRARWANQKDSLQTDIGMLESQIASRWHLVERAS